MTLTPTPTPQHHSTSSTMSMSTISLDPVTVDYLISHFPNLDSLDAQLDTQWCDINRRKEELLLRSKQLDNETPKLIQHILHTSKSAQKSLGTLANTRHQLLQSLSDYLYSKSSTSTSPSTSTSTSSSTSTKWASSIFVEKIATVKRDLNRLELTKTYMNVLLEFDEYSNDFHSILLEAAALSPTNSSKSSNNANSPTGSITTTTDASSRALEPYNKIVQLWNSCFNPQNGILIYTTTSHETDGTFTNLKTFLSEKILTMYQTLRTTFATKMSDILHSLNHPSTPISIETIPPSIAEDLRNSIINLLLLTPPSTIGITTDEIDILEPIRVYADAILKRFKFHFMSKRPTNRLDKPEWFYTNILNAIDDHDSFLTQFMQYVVEAFGLGHRDVKNEFIHLLINQVYTKIRNDVPKLLSPSSLKAGILPHYIMETISFDAVVRDVLLYSPPSNELKWKGCVEVLVGDSDVFNAWMDLEYDVAQARLKELMNPEQAWELQYDLSMSNLFANTGDGISRNSTDDASKFPKSLVGLLMILENITERYRNLQSPSHRLSIFCKLHIPLLQTYLNRCSRLLEACLGDRGRGLFKQFRAVKGQVDGNTINDTDEQVVEQVDDYEVLKRCFARRRGLFKEISDMNTTGLVLHTEDRIEILCRLVCGIAGVRDWMEEWGDDVFFLSIYQHMNSGQGSNAFGTVFDDAVEDYERLLRRLVMEVEDVVVRNVVNCLGGYKSKRWIIQSQSQSYDLSPELSDALLTLSSCLYAVSNGVFGRLYYSSLTITVSDEHKPQTTTQLPGLLYRISSSLETWLLHHILFNRSFTDHGAQIFKSDIQNLASIFHREETRSSLSKLSRLKSLGVECDNTTCLAKLVAMTRILALPSRESDRTDSVDIGTIVQVLMDVDAGNVEIKSVLKNLGVGGLEVEEVKDVLRRRMDVGRV